MSGNIFKDLTCEKIATALLGKEIYKLITFAGIPTEYNIFQLTGAVRIGDIHGHVDTIIEAVASTVYLQLYSTAPSTVDISDNAGTQLNGIVVGSLLSRNAPSTSILDLAEPDGAAKMSENTNWRDPITYIDIVADDSNPTYIRLVLSAALASGAIHWHCRWQPLSEDGLLVPV